MPSESGSVTTETTAENMLEAFHIDEQPAAATTCASSSKRRVTPLILVPAQGGPKNTAASPAETAKHALRAMDPSRVFSEMWTELKAVLAEVADNASEAAESDADSSDAARLLAKASGSSPHPVFSELLLDIFQAFWVRCCDYYLIHFPLLLTLFHDQAAVFQWDSSLDAAAERAERVREALAAQAAPDLWRPRFAAMLKALQVPEPDSDKLLVRILKAVADWIARSRVSAVVTAVSGSSLHGAVVSESVHTMRRQICNHIVKHDIEALEAFLSTHQGSQSGHMQRECEERRRHLSILTSQFVLNHHQTGENASLECVPVLYSFVATVDELLESKMRATATTTQHRMVIGDVLKNSCIIRQWHALMVEAAGRIDHKMTPIEEIKMMSAFVNKVMCLMHHANCRLTDFQYCKLAIDRRHRSAHTRSVILRRRQSSLTEAGQSASLGAMEAESQPGSN